MLHKKSNISASFLDHLKFREYIYIFWENFEKPKQNNYNQDNLHFETTIYRVLHKRSNNTASFEEHLQFPEKLTFADVLWIYCSQFKEKTGITTLYNLKWLHTESSTKEAIKLLPLQST